MYTITYLFIVTLAALEVLGFDCEAPFECIPKSECSAQKGKFPCNARRTKYCCMQKGEEPEEAEEQPTSPATTKKPEPAALKTLVTRLKTHSNFGLLPFCSAPDPTANKITDGDVAQRGAFPWMALLFFEDRFEDQRRTAPSCGGSIINKRYILTAAHCFSVQNRELKYVRLGEHNYREACPDATKTHCPQNFNVEKVTVHPEYNTSSFKNDIAIVRVDRDIFPSVNPNIHPVCLPFHMEPEKLDVTGTFVASGWGKTDWSSSEISDVLRFVEIKGSGSCDICSGVDPICPINNQTQICLQATNPKKDACKGDSGGPLVNKADSIQVGIVSFKTDEKCGAVGLPSVYTRVGAYLKWILDTIKP